MSYQLRDRLQAGLRAAMKDRDLLRVSVLRTALAEVANAEAVDATGTRAASGLFSTEVERRYLSDGDVRAIVEATRDELSGAARRLRGLGHPDAAGVLDTKAQMLRSYLAEA